MTAPTASRQKRIYQLRAMLETLERVTPDSRYSVAETIVRTLRGEALDPDINFRPSQRQTVVSSLDDLEHEVSQGVPEPSAFDRKAQILIDVFAIV
jgi:hypothetical protein